MARRYTGALFLLWLATLALPALAFEIRSIEVLTEGNTFRLEAGFTVERRSDKVYALLSDYDRWSVLSSVVQESERLISFGSRLHHVRTVSRVCIFFVCGTVMQVQLVEERPQRELKARTLAAQSNLRQGRLHWHLAPEGAATRVALTIEITPDFWVPPVIGRWLIESTLRTQVHELAASLEREPVREGNR